MQRATIATLSAVVCAVGFAAARGEGTAMFDRVGAGVIAGGLIGAAVGSLAHGLVATALRLDTQAAFQALIVGFGAKALGALLPWAAFSFVPQANALADPIAYLVAYAAAVLLVLFAGVFDNLHLSNEIALDAMDAERADGAAAERSGRTASSSPPAPPQGSSAPLESAS